MFKNQVALITGGTRGIGLAIAQCLAKQGASVIITGRSPRPSILEFALENFQYQQVDFCEESSLTAFLEWIKLNPQIDICINNAGINIIRPLEEISRQQFDEVIHVNARVPFLISQTVAENMKKQNYGRIVNIASIWSVITRSGRLSYTTAKTALVGMTRTLAIELAPYQITVNSISPGFVMTDLTRQSLNDEELKKLSSQVPLGRFANPQEIAEVVSLLCNPRNTYLTGQNIVVDGGLTCSL